MTARQFLWQVAKHLFTSAAAVADHAQVIEREHRQIDLSGIGNAGYGMRVHLSKFHLQAVCCRHDGLLSLSDGNAPEGL